MQPSPVPPQAAAQRRLYWRARDRDLILRRLGPLPGPTPAPALVLLAGLPGSGKSHFARLLRARVPIVVVESDAIRKALVVRPQYTDPEHARVFGTAHAVLEELLHRGNSVIFDATNLRESARGQVYRIARRVGARLIIAWLEAPEDVVRGRLQQRVRSADPLDHSDATLEVHREMAAGVEPVRRRHYRVDTSRDLAPALDAVAAEIRGDEVPLFPVL